ncbi:hypothetical protein EKD04_006170 [Chloroflexales bacterium ZM16-3]|nr:hypothetical protein [Chloroflexales bacterium ZM16-3]
MTDKEIEKSISAFVPEAEKEQQDDPKTYLKGTVALVIGFAAQADRPNRMDRNLYKLLEQLSTESNELVLMNLCRRRRPAP